MQLHEARNDAIGNLHQAEQATIREREWRQRESEQRARLESTQQQLRAQLRESFAARAEAAVTSRAVGQRFDALRYLKQASEVPAPPVMDEAFKIRLRSVAAAALSLDDVRVRWQSSPNPHGSSLDSMDFSPAMTFFTRQVKDDVQVVRVEDEKVVAAFPVSNYLMTAYFGNQGRHLATIVEPEDDAGVEVWDWQAKRRVAALSSATLSSAPQRWAIDIDDANARLALGLADGRVVLWHLESDTLLQSFSGPAAPAAKVRFSPDGRFVAATYIAPRKLCVWESESGNLVAERSFSEDVFAIAWSSDGKTLAVGPGFEIHLLSTEDWTAPPLRVFMGPAEIIAELVFHPSGKMLASYGYRGKSRLWRCADGAMLLETNGHANRFSASGDQLSFRTVDHAGIWDVAFEDVLWRQRDAAARAFGPKVIEFLDKQELLAVAGDSGVEVWRVDERRRVHRWEEADVTDLHWIPEAKCLAVASAQGLRLLPREAMMGGNRDTTDPDGAAINLEVQQGKRPVMVSASATGDLIGVTTLDGCVAVMLDRRHWIEIASDDPSYHYVAVSSDGHWLAAGRSNKPGFSVWNLGALFSSPASQHNGNGALSSAPIAAQVERLPINTRQSGPVLFVAMQSASHLITCESTEYRVWQLADSSPPAPIATFPRPQGYQLGGFAWDGAQHLAVGKDRSTTTLIDAAYREVVSLADPIQKAPTKDLTLQPGGRFLGQSLAEEGFAVWNLDRLLRELNVLGLK
jgi:WD40 repeat protein